MKPKIFTIDSHRLSTCSDEAALEYGSDGSQTPPQRPISPTSTASLEGSEKSIHKGSHHSNHSHPPLSTCSTLLYLIKGNLGAGLFAIPAAFKDAGLIGGSIGIPFMAALSIHCMHMLVKCSTVMKERKGNPDMAMDYSEVLETACLTGPRKVAKYATIARRFVKWALFIKELAFCSVFILFAATYFEQLMSYFYKDLDWNVRVWTGILSVPALLLGCVRNYKYLYPLSYVASLIKAVSLVVLFFYIFDDLPMPSERPAWSSVRYMLLYYGTVIFAFEGVTQVLPLHGNMRTTRHFRGLTGVLNTGMVIISALYFTVGFYGYLKYGDYTYPSITMNLPKDQLASQLVKAGLIISLMIGYGLQFHAAVEVTQPTINRLYSSDRKRLAIEWAIRAGLLIASVLGAIVVVDLDLFISLVGAFTCTFLCLTLPALLDLIVFWDKMGILRLAKNGLIMLFALLAFLTATAAAIIFLIDYFNHLDDDDDSYLPDCKGPDC